MDTSNKTNRATLKGYFVENAIPTQRNFEELIDGALNQADDGIAKISGEPLSLQPDISDNGLKKILNLYKDFTDAKPAWTISLNPRANLNDEASARPGWAVSGADDLSKLFIDESTGHIGVGTIDPGNYKLNVKGGALFDGDQVHVSAGNAGRLRVGAAWGMPGLYAGDDGAGPLVLGVESGQKVYLGKADGDAFVEGGTGNAYFKGSVGIGATASLDSELTVFSNKDNSGLTLQTANNLHSQGLAFRNSGNAYTWFIHRKNAGSDQAALVFSGGEASGDISTLPERLRIANNGNFGIGTATPAAKLSINGGLHVGGDSDPGDNNLLADGNIECQNLSATEMSLGSITMAGYSFSDIAEWQNGFIWLRDYDQNWDEFLYKYKSGTGKFNRAGFGIHMHSSKQFGFLSSGNKKLFAVEGDSGDTYIKGNVGIGTTNPTAKLTVNGGLNVSGNITARDVSIGADWQLDQGSWQDANIMYNGPNTTANFGFHGSGGKGLNVIVDSKVGIGTTAPQASLSIAGGGKENGPDGSMHITNNCILFGGNNNERETNSAQISAGKHIGNSLNIVGMSTGTDGTTRRVDMWTEGGLKIYGPTFHRDYVGIGTDGPDFPLHVVGGVNSQFNYGYFNRNGSTGTGNSNWSYSIYTDNNIAAFEFNAHSDARIKQIKGVSDPVTDLALLLKLQVTDYGYIDTIQNGDAEKKGLIAQQVEEVFPQAVNQSTDFIPDIFSLSETLEYQADQSRLTVSLSTSHPLKPGDKVRFVIEGQGQIDKIVAAVSEEGLSFSVDGWDQDVDKVFVYGKQVDDFRSIDFDRIQMLCISAVQQHENRIQQLEQDYRELKAQLARLLETK